MRRPRTSTPMDTPRASPWLDPPPPGDGVNGGGDSGGGDLHRRRASPVAGGAGAGWFVGGRIAGSTSWSGKSPASETRTAVGEAKTMFYQLLLWPLTLCMMLVSSAYRFTLRIGCHSSPLSFRDPPRWLVRLVSKPCRLLNPPAVLGADNLKGSVGSAGLAAAATGGHQGGGGIGRTAGGGTAGRGGGDGEAALAGGTMASAAAAAAGGAVSSPSRPVLLVGNQNLLGLDSLAMLNEVQGLTGVYPRFLYDTLFGSVPGVKQFLEAVGGATGTTGNCEALMSAGRCLLLYPGGAREALKSGKAEKYQLMWQEKIGFARLAVKHGYTLLPFASVGFEDAVAIATLGLDVTWLAKQAEPKWDTGGGSRLRIPFLFPYNSLERQYFAFGEPIETAHLGGDWENSTKSVGVYDKAKKEVERLIAHLQQLQQRDPDRFLPRRAWRRVRRMLGGLRDEEVSW
eukprot:g13829.t1